MVTVTAIGDVPDAQPECQHHWVIDSARGPTSWGFCRRCGTARVFSNSCSGVIWEDNALSDFLRSSPIYSVWQQRLRPLSLVSEDQGDKVEADAC